MDRGAGGVVDRPAEIAGRIAAKKKREALVGELEGSGQPVHPLDDLALAVGALGGHVAHRRIAFGLIEGEALLLDLTKKLDRAVAFVVYQGHQIPSHESGIA